MLEDTDVTSCVCLGRDPRMTLQECEDLKKENKYLSNEIHMERIMMRTENELTMRNLRNLNQELQAQVKEVGGDPDQSKA